MEIRQIRYFVEVANVGQFSLAATNLGVGQSTISEQIKALERTLGVELFSRTSRSVVLTSAGEAILPGAVRVLDDLGSLQEMAGEYGQGKRGTIRIGAIGPALGSLVPPFLRELAVQAPNVGVEVETASTEKQIQRVLNGELDAGFVRAVKRQTGIRVEDLLSEPLAAVLPAGHRLAQRESIRLAELDGEVFVFWPRGANTSFYDQVIATCHQHGCAPGRFVASGDMQTQLAYVSAGLGVSVMPNSTKQITRGDLVFVPLDGPVRPVALQVIWSPQHESPTLRRVLDVARRVSNFAQVTSRQ